MASKMAQIMEMKKELDHLKTILEIMKETEKVKKDLEQKPKASEKPKESEKPTKKQDTTDSYSLGTYPDMSMTTTNLNNQVVKEVFYRILTDYKDNFKTPLIKKRLYNKIMKANAEEMASLIQRAFNPNYPKRMNPFTKDRFLKDFAYKTLK